MESNDFKLDFRIMYISVLLHWCIIIVAVTKGIILHQSNQTINIANLLFSLVNGIILASDAHKRKIAGWPLMLLIGSVISATIYLFKRTRTLKMTESI